MIDIRHLDLRPYAFEGNFGLERKAQRVTADGRMAQMPHPFPPHGNEYIFNPDDYRMVYMDFARL